MKLHLDSEFKNLITIVAKDLGILEFYVEKDYWITYILNKLSKSSYKNEVVFKGGTSLSKVFDDLINRFSEDIDLQLIEQDLTSSGKKKKLKEIEKAIIDSEVLNVVNEDEITKKNGKMRRTVYEYPVNCSVSGIGQASDKLLLEIVSYSSSIPRKMHKIETYIAKYLKKIGEKDIISKFELEEFEINVLSIERTFLEKLFAIIEASLKESNIEELKNKIRHLYDIYVIYTKKEDIISTFLSEKSSFDICNLIYKENIHIDISEKKYCDSFLFTDFEKINEIKKTYENEFSKLVFKELPNFEDLKVTLKKFLNFIKEWEEKYKN